MGGWITRPGSCSNGVKSRPSDGAGNCRANGLDSVRMKARKPTDTAPITPSTCATKACGKRLENVATATDHSASINTHRSSEPSCPAQMAERRYGVGSKVLEWWATYLTLKSCTKNACHKAPKANTIKANCKTAKGRASACQPARRADRLPHSGSTACSTATQAAMIKAMWPTSGHMLGSCASGGGHRCTAAPMRALAASSSACWASGGM